MNTGVRNGFRRTIGALCLVLLLSVAAAARDPAWYGDVQYLTWDERLTAPEENHAVVGLEGQVYLQLPDESRAAATNGLGDAGGSNGRGSDLVSGCRRQITCLARKVAEQASRYYRVCVSSSHGSGDGDPVPSRIARRSAAATR